MNSIQPVLEGFPRKVLFMGPQGVFLDKIPVNLHQYGRVNVKTKCYANVKTTYDFLAHLFLLLLQSRKICLGRLQLFYVDFTISLFDIKSLGWKFAETRLFPQIIGYNFTSISSARAISFILTFTVNRIYLNRLLYTSPDLSLQF